MFSVGNEKASQVVQKLKRAKATQLMELEELVLELEAKCKIKNVIHKMEQLIMDGKIIRSVEDIGDALNEQPSKTKTRVVKCKE